MRDWVAARQAAAIEQTITQIKNGPANAAIHTCLINSQAVNYSFCDNAAKLC